MPRIALSAPLVLALLGACAMEEREAPVVPHASIKPQELPYKAGAGRVEKIVHLTAPVPAAATGGSAPDPADARRPVRVTVRMDDGTVQYINTERAELQEGQRVVLSESRVIRPLP